MFGRGQGISYGGIPKLIAPEISLGGNFSYDVNGLYYSTTTIYGYIKRPEIKISYETLLAIMNSELCWWFLMNTGTVLANGYFRYKPTYLKPFPLPNISQEDDKNICNLVKQRMNNISLDNNLVIDHKINNYIYNMYNLSHEEIEIISEKKQ